MLVLMLMTIATPIEVLDPIEACTAAAIALRDMRYTEYGKFSDRKDLTHPKIQARIARCVKIATLASPHGRDVVFVSIAIGFNETNFRENVGGKAGEVGMMHVLPVYACKPYKDLNDGNGGCTNPLRAGVRTVRMFLKGKTWENALRQYNGSSSYGKKVAAYARAIERAYNRSRRTE